MELKANKALLAITPTFYRNPFNGIESGQDSRRLQGDIRLNPFNGIERNILHVRGKHLPKPPRIHSMELKEIYVEYWG